MTTSVKIKSANYPVRVRVLDMQASGLTHVAEQRVLWPEDGEVQFYATVGRQITAVDLEYTDPVAMADRSARFPAPKEDGA